MKIHSIKIAISSVAFFIMGQNGYGQGTFINLNFESPQPPLTRDAEFMVPIANALPGWTGYIGGNQVTRVVYDTRSLGAAAISLLSTFSIAGNYSVFLQGQFNPNDIPGLPSAAIAQTGQIPMGTQSLVFWGDTLLLHLKMQRLPYIVLLLFANVHQHS